MKKRKKHRRRRASPWASAQIWRGSSRPAGLDLVKGRRGQRSAAGAGLRTRQRRGSTQTGEGTCRCSSSFPYAEAEAGDEDLQRRLGGSWSPEEVRPVLEEIEARTAARSKGRRRRTRSGRRGRHRSSRRLGRAGGARASGAGAEGTEAPWQGNGSSGGGKLGGIHGRRRGTIPAETR